ncbi:MAG: hypothetical protein KC713_03935 [Candidatus Omnitrophica bacterium]|nr:hypothetical protein [Candidatus Omnitrophota bacterium]
MLRRKQVMVSDWLDDFIIEISQHYNLSYSEAVRIMLSFGFAQVVTKISPDYSFSIDAQDIADASKERNNGKINPEIKRKLTADIYFEARNILENYLKKAKKVHSQDISGIKTSENSLQTV